MGHLFPGKWNLGLPLKTSVKIGPVGTAAHNQDAALRKSGNAGRVQSAVPAILGLAHEPGLFGEFDGF
jgi:hypothetical protein